MDSPLRIFAPRGRVAYPRAVAWAGGLWHGLILPRDDDETGRSIRDQARSDLATNHDSFLEPWLVVIGPRGQQLRPSMDKVTEEENRNEDDDGEYDGKHITSSGH
ncbi:hypothetical protein CDL15_Pgr014585 [Punica granatum]|uniref:Uncharacterized protein n=1 Tax=Punica granatum TaxID=22663 RepID=A0A218WFS4_PUNGR|nr:hypothetical protein CDL15_Pgr014585 [Punica granatum]